MRALDTLHTTIVQNFSHSWMCLNSCSHATGQPGIAIPHVTSVEIDPSFKYLILMTDGVYKALEAVAGPNGGNGNDLIANMIYKRVSEHDFEDNMAQDILDNVCQTQYDLYQRSASEDPHSDVAVANRKRDDMTLVIYQFKFEDLS